jgi:hypothetical protein
MECLARLFIAEEVLGKGIPSPHFSLYLLQSILNKAKDLGFLNLPIPLSSTSDFPIIQYADDTLIIMEGMPGNFSS